MIDPKEPGYYHAQMPAIVLPATGELRAAAPELESLTPQWADRERLIGESSRLAARAAKLVFANEPGAPETGPETHHQVADAWRKFFRCHFLFFYDFALLAEGYRLGARALADGNMEAAGTQVNLIHGLWRSAGSLIAYGVSFTPTETIYKKHIRPAMPEGFSGTWLWEYALLTARRKVWETALQSCTHPDGASFAKILRSAEGLYHRLHLAAMVACIPEKQSLLGEYERSHGRVILEEPVFGIYDSWFHVHRSETFDVEEFVGAGIRICEELIDDLDCESTRLNGVTKALAAAGVEAKMTAFAHWLQRRPEEGRRAPDQTEMALTEPLSA